MGSGGGDSSSGEEDGDAAWRAAIDSVAVVHPPSRVSNGTSTRRAGSEDDPDQQHRDKKEAPALKLYQIKAQKLLDDLIGKSLEMVTNPSAHSVNDSQSNQGGIRLFSKAPLGVILDPIDAHPLPRKRPRILPGEAVDEKSKKFKRQIRSVAVDGSDVMVSAKNACQRLLVKFEARDAAAKAAARREEERITELKRIRGEKWLPSIAKEMQGKN